MSAAGIRIGKSTYAEYESGSKAPSRNHMPLLESFWGPATGLEATQGGDDLAGAIRGLTDELRSWRTEDRAKLAELELVVSRLVSERLSAAAAEGSPAPGLPRVGVES